MPKNLKQLNKGGYGSGQLDSDDLAFLKVDLDPWDHESASGTYQARRFDDATGHVRGANWDDSNDHGLRNKMPDEYGDVAHERLAGLIDGQEDMPAGKYLGGGGPVSDNAPDHGGGWEGSGRKGPRYAPKRLAPRTNARANTWALQRGKRESPPTWRLR
jgi:hypothetical protein